MNAFEQVQQIIRNRRSTKPALFNGQSIPQEQVQQLLELADWAPTHAHTEPWRFVVYAGKAAQQFCADHADLYKSHTPADKFVTAAYEKQLHNGDKASHIIAVLMKRGDNPRIPVIEEVSAVSAAVQNILLGAETLGISVLWSTGGLTHHPALKEYFGLSEQDLVIGLLYMGYADNPVKEGKRIVPLQEKITWK